MARLYPRDLLEFERAFRTEEDCWKYLVRLRWPNGFQCPRCGGRQGWILARRLLECGSCGKMVSATAGTVFHRSHLPLRIWFRAIWWFTNQKTGVSALSLQRALGLGSYRTAWMCLHKLRRAVVRPHRELLSGKVEVDEVWVGGRTRGRGTPLEGKNVIIAAVEVRRATMGRVRLQVLKRRQEEDILRFVAKSVLRGSAIITDGWPGYNRLRDLGYAHKVHRIGDHHELAHVTMPGIHRVAALLKRWLLGVHQGRVSRKHLGHYLEEFAFRFNRRRSPSRGKLFYRLVQQAATVGPCPYQQLRAFKVSST